jgi:hypothetical protein
MSCRETYLEPGKLMMFKGGRAFVGKRPDDFEDVLANPETL